MCEALRIHNTFAISRTPEELKLAQELKVLLRLFHHHWGVIGLHTNRPKESLSHFQEFTEMLRQELGTDKPVAGKDQSLGVAWNELGNAYLQNEAHAEAEDCFLKSIDALRTLSKSTELSISMPLINLAFCHWIQGHLEESSAEFAQALTAREKEYGSNDKTSFV